MCIGAGTSDSLSRFYNQASENRKAVSLGASGDDGRSDISEKCIVKITAIYGAWLDSIRESDINFCDEGISTGYGLCGGIDKGLFCGDRLPEGHLPHGAMPVSLFARQCQ